MKLSGLQKELLNLIQIWAVFMLIAWGVDPEFPKEVKEVATLIAVSAWLYRMLWKYLD